SCKAICFMGKINDGGEGGIRTPDTLASMPHFECGAFNHSATSPAASNVRNRKAIVVEIASRRRFASERPSRRGLLYRQTQCFVNAGSRAFLHSRQDMAVQVQSHPTREWPSRSLATFGCTPLASRCVAWACL